ncbi:MAG TPA: flagellar hook-associated protein FlgK [Verrucomicrobiae bacterium]|nr:flagellar hook-associated protein FlgK [Verrucomicrobiae bacterium]
MSLGLFGSLNLAARSLQVQQQGIEVAGHNLANVNNPAYARQRVAIHSAGAIQTNDGFIQGVGADIAGITQVRNALLDAQMVSENSVTGSLEAQQQALQYAQADLGQQIDQRASGAEGAAAASGIGQHGIGDAMNDLFNSFQALSTQPSSTTQRDIVLTKAAQLAERFQATDDRLAALNTSLNTSVETEVSGANALLSEIAQLNRKIVRAEMGSDGVANDLRDARQAKLEELGKIVKFDTSEGAAGSVNISIGGVLMVDSTEVAEALETYDVSGKTMVRAASSDAPLNITGGRIHGFIDARDGAVQGLRDNLSSLASTLITQVNLLHQSGFGKDGSTGLAFFSGTNASDISVNSALTADKIAASNTVGEVGNNKIILALAQLKEAPQSALSSQTLSQNYSRVVAKLGSDLDLVNQGVSDQAAVSNMVSTQRDSISGVSMDEEMTDVLKFQRAYQASAKIVSVIDEMLLSVINMRS